ncbi:MAG: Hydrolase [Alphaproteobacteria bacterium MarineAlpha9_Bin7]|nr:MAG: Hydrolase [Alphaproteobacteria bacterium MarineAlpha9_Bin7]
MRTACLQLTSGLVMDTNIEEAVRLARIAREQGAVFSLMPENVGLLGPGGAMRDQATPEHSHPALSSFRDLCAKTGMWILVGSLAILRDDGRLANRSFLINGTGDLVARYDKIHMFDVDLENGERYRESDAYAPGTVAQLAETPWGLVGLTICYDVRFPLLYRTLAQAGAAMVSVPSAFTCSTGAAHWHVLLRARAIETGCYVLAPAQCGTHYGKRETYGHSLIVDPWGEVLADGGDEPGVVIADLDMSDVDSARSSLPSLDHDRSFVMPRCSDVSSAVG